MTHKGLRHYLFFLEDFKAVKNPCSLSLHPFSEIEKHVLKRMRITSPHTGHFLLGTVWNQRLLIHGCRFRCNPQNPAIGLVNVLSLWNVCTRNVMASVTGPFVRSLYLWASKREGGFSETFYKIYIITRHLMSAPPWTLTGRIWGCFCWWWGAGSTAGSLTLHGIVSCETLGTVLPVRILCFVRISIPVFNLQWFCIGKMKIPRLLRCLAFLLQKTCTNLVKALKCKLGNPKQCLPASLTIVTWWLWHAV